MSILDQLGQAQRSCRKATRSSGCHSRTFLMPHWQASPAPREIAATESHKLSMRQPLSLGLRLGPCREKGTRQHHANPTGPLGWLILMFVLLVGARPVQADELLALTTDFSTGSLTSLGLTPPWNADLDVASICPDAVARSYRGLLYVVNRFGCDNIQVIDPAQDYATIREFSVGSGSNPQDIAFESPTRAFVSRYDRPTLLAVNPSTGAILDSLSLAPYADADGLPEMHRLFLQGRYLYVEVQRLDRNNGFEPVAPSYLVVIDTQTWTIVDTDDEAPGVNPIALTGLNPTGPMEIDLITGQLLVPVSGSFFDLDGGIERVDLEEWESTGFLVTEATLGGSLLQYTQGSTQRSFAIVSDASFATCLVAYHPIQGTRLQTIYCTDGFDLADCEVSEEGWLYLADRSFIDPGVRVFNLNGQPQGDVIPTGLPPFDLVIHRTTTSQAPLPGAPLITQLPAPNPAASRIQCRLALEAADVEIQVVDALGRVVRTLEATARGQVDWDLLDRAGSPAPSGLYWIRVRTPTGRNEAHRVVVMR